MRKFIERVIAAVLAIAVACQVQVPTFAAAEEKQYVSEVIVSYGEGESGEADAKAWLTDNGYEVIDTNLNAGAEAAVSDSAISWATGARAARAVYLGYKTTTDESQAITSLKTMNMTGKYSFDSYQEVLDQMADETKAFMADLQVTLKEWRENYNNGRGKAIQAYYLLQMMYSPDNNNMRMGDLLLNETKEEMGDAAYNKLSDEEKLKHADMTTILMQGNSDAMKYIEQILGMGADTDKEKTWLGRLSEMGSYDSMMDQLEQEAEEKNETFLPSDAAAELASQYDSIAQVLAVKIVSLQSSIKEYLESGTTLQDDENKITSFIDSSVNDSVAESEEWLAIGTIYESLAAFKYPSEDNPDRTLQEFFMEEFDPDDAESRTALYPMAAALSEGQRKALSFASLPELLAEGILTDDEAEKSVEGLKEYVEHEDSISVFAGVDRSIFDSTETALTSSARELQNSSQKSYTEGLFGTPFTLRTTISAAIFAVSCAAMIGCAITVSVLKSATAAKTTFDHFVSKVAANTDHLEWVADLLVQQDGNASVVAMDIIDLARNDEDVDAIMFMDEDYDALLEYVDNNQELARKATILKCFKVATGILVVVTIALGVWTVISGIQDLKAYYDRDMDLYPIPDNMVDEAQGEDGAMTYTYYKAVQSNRTAKGYTSGREVLKDNADLNGDLGKEWLALYYTKDAAAGDPITVSSLSGFKAVKGQEATPDGMTALTLFDQESPVNLTNEEWVWNDETGGLYLYYTTSTGANAASVFAGSGKWIVWAGAGILTAIIFFAGGFIFGRKRKAKGSTTAS